MGPELGEEPEQHEQQQSRQQRVTVQRAGLGERAHLRFAHEGDPHQLVDKRGDDQQGGAQQEVIEHRCQTAAQANGGEFALGAQQGFGHGRALWRKHAVYAMAPIKKPLMSYQGLFVAARISLLLVLRQPAGLFGLVLKRR